MGDSGSRLVFMDMASCLLAGSIDLGISEMIYGFGVFSCNILFPNEFPFENYQQ